MSKSKPRFILYAMTGFIFSIIDWFYLNWMVHLAWGRLGESILVVSIIIMLNYGIWLVPIIPVVIYEAKRARKIVLPMLAGILTWACAITSYYAYYGILLSLGKLIHLEHLNIFGEKSAAFWDEYWQMFNRIILGQFFEWISIAIAGGAIMGALSFWIFHVRTSYELKVG